ncbi:CAP domain-containing protein [Nicoliella lavandulae]|uniref:CAP domain-containing protein n=1 Tax=Nicoliella lavandulae TaxID=3082954 RepID=A0ABU8SM09_9LACO
MKFTQKLMVTIATFSILYEVATPITESLNHRITNVKAQAVTKENIQTKIKLTPTRNADHLMSHTISKSNNTPGTVPQSEWLHAYYYFNQMLPRYANGSKALYAHDNNSVILDHMATSETDMKGQLPMQSNGDRMTVISSKQAPWGNIYYHVRFSNGAKGWIQQSNLVNESAIYDNSKLNYTSHENNQAINTGFYYINSIRIKHGLKLFRWSDKLTKIAQARIPQLISNFGHTDSNGISYRNELAQKFGYKKYINVIGENIGTLNMYKKMSASQYIVTDINAMTYEDANDSKWGHRKNFLSRVSTTIGIAVKSDNGRFITAFEFY